MNEVQLFNFENHEVRSLLLNNEPWFVGKDVADVGITASNIISIELLEHEE